MTMTCSRNPIARLSSDGAAAAALHVLEPVTMCNKGQPCHIHMQASKQDDRAGRLLTRRLPAALGDTDGCDAIDADCASGLRGGDW